MATPTTWNPSAVSSVAARRAAPGPPVPLRTFTEIVDGAAVSVAVLDEDGGPAG